MQKEVMKKVIIYSILIVLAVLLGFLVGKYVVPVEPLTLYIEKKVTVIEYVYPEEKVPVDYGYINPIHEDDYLHLSSPPGIREIPKGIYTGGSLTGDHRDLDLYGTWKARIVSVKAGKVIDKWYVPDARRGREGHKIFGGYIKILHLDGSISEYAHCSEIYVIENQWVEQGEVIARQGNSGISDGDHLHFGLIIDGKRVNPLKYILIDS